MCLQGWSPASLDGAKGHRPQSEDTFVPSQSAISKGFLYVTGLEADYILGRWLKPGLSLWE